MIPYKFVIVVLYLIFTKVHAIKLFGRKEVHVPDEVSAWVSKTLTEMNNKFDKDPLQSVEFQCKNPATERLRSLYPDAVIRWMHNGENIKIKPATMMMSMDSLIIQNLLPEDSGVYHCVVMVTPKQPIVTAVYSLVVGEKWIHSFQMGTLKLSCNSKELGLLFKKSVRTWNHRLGKESSLATKDDAIFYNVDSRYNGTWTCIVTDLLTKRKWTTARYRVIIDPPPPLLVRLKIKIMENKMAAFGILFVTLFICMSIYEGLVERFKKKNKSFKTEMNFFKTALKLEVPGAERQNMKNQPLMQDDEAFEREET